MSTKEIIYGQYYNNATITSNEFLDFLEELIVRIDDKIVKNTLFILDNAKIHITKQIQIFCKKKGLKVLFIVPYKSQYNAIEYCFNLIKLNIYNENIITLIKLKKRIVDLINDDKINSNVNKLYKLASASVMLVKPISLIISPNTSSSPLFFASRRTRSLTLRVCCLSVSPVPVGWPLGTPRRSAG